MLTMFIASPLPHMLQERGFLAATAGPILDQVLADRANALPVREGGVVELQQVQLIRWQALLGGALCWVLAAML